MRDTEAKQNWEKENAIPVTVRINKNQDPELYELFMKADSRSNAARELMQLAIERRLADV